MFIFLKWIFFIIIINSFSKFSSSCTIGDKFLDLKPDIILPEKCNFPKNLKAFHQMFSRILLLMKSIVFYNLHLMLFVYLIGAVQFELFYVDP